MSSTDARILVVENEALIAADLESNLVSMGYDVVGIACDGPEAIVLAGQLKPELVLMDINLDGPMNGIVAAREIRSIHNISSVFLTCEGHFSFLERAEQAEPLGYLTKPFRAIDLAAAVRIALQRAADRSADRSADRNKDMRQPLLLTGHMYDELDVGLVGLDADRRVLFANSTARRFLSDTGIFDLSSGKFAGAGDTSNSKLNTLLADAEEQAPLSARAVTLNASGKSLHVCRMTENVIQEVLTSGVSVVLSMTSAEALPGSRGKLLASLFHLTPAEGRVAMLLVAGLDPATIASQTGNSVSTVRFQLKTIYRKLGISRQSQLVRLISCLPADRVAAAGLKPCPDPFQSAGSPEVF